MIQNNKRGKAIVFLHWLYQITIITAEWLYISECPHKTVCSITAPMYHLKVEMTKRNLLLRMILWPTENLYIGTCTCNLWHKVMQRRDRDRKRNTNPSDICSGVSAKNGREVCASSAAAPADCSRFAFDASVNNVGSPLRGWPCQIPN